jgi:hypothetical protein
VEVDVVPVQSEQLRPTEAGVSEEGEQESVALALAVVLAVPDGQVRARMRRLSSARSRTSGNASRFFGVRRTSAGSRSSHSDSRQKRKKPLSAATVRAWLDAAGDAALRWLGLAQIRRPDLRPTRHALLPQVRETGADVALVGPTGQLRQAPFEAAEAHERLDFSIHPNSSGQPAGPCGGMCLEDPAYRLAKGQGPASGPYPIGAGGRWRKADTTYGVCGPTIRRPIPRP